MKKIKVLSVLFFLMSVSFPIMAAEEYVGIGVYLYLSELWKVSITGSDLSNPQQKHFDETIQKLNENSKIYKVLISKIVCGGPAEWAGLKKGDAVVAVEDVALSGRTIHEIKDTIKIITNGVEGSSVNLTIERNLENTTVEQFDVNIARQKISETPDC